MCLCCGFISSFLTLSPPRRPNIVTFPPLPPILRPQSSSPSPPTLCTHTHAASILATAHLFISSVLPFWLICSFSPTALNLLLRSGASAYTSECVSVLVCVCVCAENQLHFLSVLLLPPSLTNARTHSPLLPFSPFIHSSLPPFLPSSLPPFLPFSLCHLNNTHTHAHVL